MEKGQVTIKQIINTTTANITNLIASDPQFKLNFLFPSSYISVPPLLIRKPIFLKSSIFYHKSSILSNLKYTIYIDKCKPTKTNLGLQKMIVLSLYFVLK